ncbi:glycosyltransferase family 4 protein [Chitinispirillales bacterium ANBcel5]|uniref:glycosyltransferase family 4 protein n=1 Tax=Cellulosispirillum alkaliphilum TaxID=3039283 RepID=UPI002A5855D0|nr:glycosyltransferase family 4 protein [Chitinispirillales bacterium ANBcel5]
MKILLTVHHNLTPDSGAPGITFRLSRYFKMAGHDVTIFSFSDLPSCFPEVLKKILFPFFVAVRIFKSGRKKGFDVVDSSTGDNWIWASVVKRFREFKPLLVTRSHGFELLADKRLKKEAKRGNLKLSWRYPLFHGGLMLWYVALSVRKSDVVLFLNSTERDYAVQRLRLDPRRTIIVQHDISDLFANLPFYSIKKNTTPAIAVTGSFITKKGISYSMPALRKLLTLHSHLRVKFLGTGPCVRSIVNLFSSCEKERIEIYPSYRNKDLPDLLRDCQIALLPSISEGFGIALIESMACGLAPVASAIDGPLDYIKNGENGLLISPGSVEEIVTGINSLLRDKRYLENLRMRAWITAQHYCSRKNSNHQLAVYEEFMKKAKANI